MLPAAWFYCRNVERVKVAELHCGGAAAACIEVCVLVYSVEGRAVMGIYAIGMTGDAIDRESRVIASLTFFQVNGS